MVYLQKVLGFFSRHWLLVVLVIVSLGAGHLLGYWLHPRTIVKTQEVIKWQEKQVIQTVTVEKPVVKWQTRTVTVYIPGTTTPKETIVTQAETVSGGSSTKTSAETESKSAESSQSTVTQNTEGRWNVRAMAGISLSSGSVVGAGAEYRLVGPLTVGAELTIPLSAPNATQVLLSVGLRL